ncbi:TPA: Outer dynein arm protein 1 [Trebouxia sp. C0005]
MPAEAGATLSKSQHSVFAETQQFFVKQRAAIAKLREDNAKLKEELLLENKFSVTPTSSNLSANIANLQDQSDVYTRKIGLERSRLLELEEKANSLQGKIGTQRKAMGGLNAAREANIQTQKQIRILENRLEKMYHKYNESKSRNEVLRTGIDNLRRERLVFDDIHRKLAKSLLVKKKEMAGVIAHTNHILESRDKAIAEMGMIKAQGDREQAMSEAEWKQLSNLIENDRREREAAREREIEERERKLGALMAEKGSLALKKKTSKEEWSLKHKDKASAASMERVQHFGESFAKIQEATGMKDIDAIVERFMEAEDANFSLFNYVNEVNAEVEKLEEQIAEIKEEIEKYRGENVTAESERHRELSQLEERLSEIQEQAAWYQHKHQAAVKRVDQLKEGISNMFEQAGCGTPAVRSLLGEEGVSEGNMMQYLGILEQRTNEILQEYVAAVAQDQTAAAEKAAMLMSATGGSPAGVGSEYVIEPPSTLAAEDSDDNSDGENDDVAPLDRQALETRIQKNIAKKGDSIKLKPVSAQKVSAHKSHQSPTK